MGDDIGLGSVSYFFFAQPTSCSSVCFLRSEIDLKKQSVTEPKPMASPINYLANKILGQVVGSKLLQKTGSCRVKSSQKKMHTANIHPSDRFIVQPDQKLVSQTSVQWCKTLPEEGIVIFISCKKIRITNQKANVIVQQILNLSNQNVLSLILACKM